MKTRWLVLILAILVIGMHGFAAEKRVKLLTLEWEPYAGSQMPNKGFVSTVIIQAYKKAGYKVNIDFQPWDKALKMTAEGQVDGIYPTYHSREREEVFFFSEVICESPLGLCKRRNMSRPSPGGGLPTQGHYINFVTDPRIDQAQALRDLKSYKFGAVKGYVNTPEFDGANFLTKILVDTDEANIGQLLRDEVQLIVIDKYVARNIVIKKFPWFSGEVEFMHPPLSVKRLYLSVSKKTDDSEKKLRAFNAGFKVLVQDGIFENLKRIYGF